MNLNSIPAFQNNYIWVLSNNGQHCLIVDPDEAAPVLEAITGHNWVPEAIPLAHHHQGHVGGVRGLLRHYPQIMIYGPAETQDEGTTHVAGDGDIALILGHEFRVIATPGHTLRHACYFSHPYLFCDDMLFSGGCGRLFEDTVAQMYQSFKKINEPPDDASTCCAHEYILTNTKFALSILPHDSLINEYHRRVNELRVRKQIALPVVLKNERRDNLFSKTEDIDLINEISKETILQQPGERFAWLKSERDTF